MIIREMKLEDVPHVAAIEQLCFSAPWNENMIISSWESRLSCWLIAEIDGCVAGYVGSEAVLDSADMMNIAVAPAYRKRGIAEALIKALVEHLQQRDILFLLLEVRVSNAPAIALYNKLCFEQVGRRPRYYTNPREDALILRKELKP
jgi:ribosomal-protein-alanine N-acetyltransferase